MKMGRKDDGEDDEDEKKEDNKNDNVRCLKQGDQARESSYGYAGES